jgi:RNA polymerase sigma factor (sigma-70 family)
LSDLSQLSDEELARQSRDGSQAAFTELMRRHKHGVYKALGRLCDTPDQRYEATQETFVKAWLNIRRYNPERPFASWLYTVGANVARDLYRRRKVRSIVTGEAGLFNFATAMVADGSPPQDEWLIEQHRLKALRNAMAKLPESLMAPLRLTVFEGRSHKEAGAILGITVKAVELRLARTRKRLALAVGEA